METLLIDFNIQNQPVYIAQNTKNSYSIKLNEIPLDIVKHMGCRDEREKMKRSVRILYQRCVWKTAKF